MNKELLSLLRVLRPDWTKAVEANVEYVWHLWGGGLSAKVAGAYYRLDVGRFPWSKVTAIKVPHSPPAGVLAPGVGVPIRVRLYLNRLAKQKGGTK